MKVQIIKNYQRLTSSLTSAADLPIFEDRAVADFRGFYSIAQIHTQRVRNPLVVDTMCEILDSLKNDLLSRKKVID